MLQGIGDSRRLLRVWLPLGIVVSDGEAIFLIDDWVTADMDSQIQGTKRDCHYDSSLTVS